MIGSVPTQELQDIIVGDNNIQDKSNELLGGELYVYRNIDFNTIDVKNIRTPHCNIIFGSKTEDDHLVNYSVYIGFSTMLIGNKEDTGVTYDNTDIHLEEVIALVVKTLKEEMEVGLGDEQGFEISSTHIEPFVQNGQKDSAFILELEISQKIC